jgi:hypothetical protein
MYGFKVSEMMRACAAMAANSKRKLEEAEAVKAMLQAESKRLGTTERNMERNMERKPKIPRPNARGKAGQPRKWTDEQDLLACELMRSGKTMQQTAQITGMSIPYLDALRAKHGLRNKIVKHTVEQKATVHKMKMNGFTNNQIAEALGIGLDLIGTWVRMGVTKDAFEAIKRKEQ